MLVAVGLVFSHLFDVCIGGFITGGRDGVGSERMRVRVRDLFERLWCRFRPRCRGTLSAGEVVVFFVCCVV